MRGRPAAMGLLALLAGCGGTAPAAVLTHAQVKAAVGCRGWYEVAGRTLYAHLVFTGDVRATSVSATLTDGSSFVPSSTVPVTAGVARQTVPLGPLTAGVVAASASVFGASPTEAAGCTLATPH
ncbi:MAG: hypothetical protein ACTHMZ_04510 [Actinomycetes bacterium]